MNITQVQVKTREPVRSVLTPLTLQRKMVLMRNLALLCFIVTGATASHALLLNGSFQDGTGLMADHWTLSGSNAAAVTDQTYINVGASGASPFGGRFLSFNGGDTTPTNVAEQSFTTVAGQQYLVSLQWGVYGVANPQTLTVELHDSVDGLIESESFQKFGNGYILDYIFGPESFSFTATGNQTTIRLLDVGSTTISNDMFIDDVAVEAVPEPATLALACFGLLALRRKRV